MMNCVDGHVRATKSSSPRSFAVPSARESSYVISARPRAVWMLRNCAVYGTVNTRTWLMSYISCSGRVIDSMKLAGLAWGLKGSSSREDSQVPGTEMTSTAGHQSGSAGAAASEVVSRGPSADGTSVSEVVRHW